MKIFKKDGLKYVDQGQGETILFSHGWGMSPFSYKIIIISLASKFRVIAPFITTFRKSDSKEIIKILDQKAKIIVMAHSAGGIPALAFCNQFPDRIKALVLIDTVGGGKSDSIKKWGWLKEAGRYLTKPTKLTKILFTDVLRQLVNVKKLLGDSEFILAYKTNLKPDFPVLMLWGKEDSLIPVVNGYNLNKLIPKAEFKSVSGGHFWFLEKPEILTKYLEEFLNK
jgi:pimeloyl-ACP methyl ester carboxylesterase